MELVLGFVVLLLAGAVALLFAMVGELAARVPGTGVDATPQPLEEARLGAAPTVWPEPLEAMMKVVDRVEVLVLSSACATCETVAAQLAAELNRGTMARTAVVVSCADVAAGNELADRYALRRLPCFVDEGGDWVRGAFGVETSPTALVIHGGRLESAVVFTDLAALRLAVTEREEIAA